MKKSLIAVLFVPVIFLVAFMMVSAGDGPWMDMKNCEMCKTLTKEDPALLKNMTWEHHKISDGLVTVSTVAPAFVEHYKRASDRMDQVAEKLQKGGRPDRPRASNDQHTLSSQVDRVLGGIQVGLKKALASPADGAGERQRAFIEGQ